MKKQTLQKWINQQRKIANQEPQEALRTARQDALAQCEGWLYELTWATMRAPVRKRCETLRLDGQALLQKGAQCSQAENERLEVVRASHAIYAIFLHKLAPTAFQAEFEQRAKQQERARRQGRSSSLPEPHAHKTERSK